jgi:hypothetical protein
MDSPVIASTPVINSRPPQRNQQRQSQQQQQQQQDESNSSRSNTDDISNWESIAAKTNNTEIINENNVITSQVFSNLKLLLKEIHETEWIYETNSD